jgi:hypothetical protein
MGVMVIVGYRPRPGKEARLIELTRTHVPRLREQGLATDRAPYVMRAADGTIVEVFEWTSKEAIASAHTNPVVATMWQEYGEVCDYVPLATLAECDGMFASFEPVAP